MDKKIKRERPPVRRIYKGEVPSIYDYDKDLLQKVMCQTHKRCFRFPSSKISVLDDHTPPNNVPVPVRRQSAVNDQPPPVEKFPDNSITTSRVPSINTIPYHQSLPTKYMLLKSHYFFLKYTMWNFLPKNLFEQFRRLVNFYFLVGALIHSIIDSPVHPFTAVAPLTFVILVSAIKQGYEDWLRHKNDDQVNNRAVRVIRKGDLLEIKSKDIQVGDVVKLDAEEQVLTDLLLLGSTDPYLRCQLNTANLDGETNLKLRYCPSGIPRFKKPEDFNHLHCIVECEHPCEDLYEFSGTLLLPADKLSEMRWSPTESLMNVEEKENNDDKGECSVKNDQIECLRNSGLVRQGLTDFISIPLSMENMVLRGTRLKNTDSIYGLVIYTGKDTRLARNSEKTQAKFSTVESAVNVYLIFFIGLLLLIVVVCTVMRFAFKWYPDSEIPWYAQDYPRPKPDTSDQLNMRVLQTLASFIVLFNYIIPISLYVTIELQKFLGSKFFVWDNEMVDEEGKEPLCNTSDLNEELGQIEYLFSDKTGTLTQNVMQFRHCSIEAARYEYRGDDRLYSLRTVSRSRDELLDLNRQVDMAGNKEVLNFFRTLALCHSVQVVPKRRPSYDVGLTTAPILDTKILKIDGRAGGLTNVRVSLVPGTDEVVKRDPMLEASVTEFQASSPDEKALLEACQMLGIRYQGEKEDMLTLNTFGTVEKFKRLMHLEFDADRKCMSVIIENNKGEIWLLTKGAESSIIPKCDHGPTVEILRNVMDYALMGLRTLVVAHRKLTIKEYEEFTIELRAARRLIKNRQERVREVYSSIESHMTLIGATGVEDQLQDDVPETLQSFAAAGIRVWMLTGDKLETGVNVAVSCGLITASTKQFILSKTGDAIEVIEKLEQFKKDIDPADNTCFVVDGEGLAIAFKECPELLRDVSMSAFRVVCCRMAPLQKAQVLQMVKNSPSKPCCCAVGDGANDCAMILAAHVGIGILGKEGRQAARCADFALAKFGFLRKAILVHGHWYYVRLANLANYFFYKNVVFVLPQFFFSFHSNFSTEALFNGIFLMGFNIFFAACPIFYYGLTEQPYSSKTLMAFPPLYRKNKKNALMSFRKFVPWMLSAFWHASVCYFLTYLAWDNFHDINDLSSYGTIIFTGVIVTVNLKIFIETKFISIWYIFAHFYSYATYFVITNFYSELELRMLWHGFLAHDFHHVFRRIILSVNFWLLLPLITVVAILPDIICKSFGMLEKHRMKLEKDFGPKRGSEEQAEADFRLSYESRRDS